MPVNICVFLSVWTKNLFKRLKAFLYKEIHGGKKTAMVLPVRNFYCMDSHCKGRLLIRWRQNLTCNSTQFPQNHREREMQKDFTSLPLCPGSASVTHVCQEGRMELSKEARLWKGTGLDFSCPMFSMTITFLQRVLCFCRMTLGAGEGRGNYREYGLIYLEHLASFPGVSNNMLNHGRDRWERNRRVPFSAAPLSKQNFSVVQNNQACIIETDFHFEICH